MKNYRTFIVIPEAVKQARITQNNFENNFEPFDIAALNLVQDDWFRKEDFISSSDRDSRVIISNYTM
jgi:hypothetical protein